MCNKCFCREWVLQNIEYPYANNKELDEFSETMGMTRTQVSHQDLPVVLFIINKNRNLKPGYMRHVLCSSIRELAFVNTSCNYFKGTWNTWSVTPFNIKAPPLG